MSLTLEHSTLENAIRQLLADPTSFDFFEAVRRIQRVAFRARTVAAGEHPEPAAAWGAPLGAGNSARTPIVFFRSHVSNSFPASSIQDVQRIQFRDRQGRLSQKLEMTVNFMGLHGPNGILPKHYNDMIIQLQRNNLTKESGALRDWFDLFNNRMIALFYLAWERTQIPVQRERSMISGLQDPFGNFFKSLGGLHTEGLQRRVQVRTASGDQAGHTMSDLFLSTFLGRSRPRMSVALVQTLIAKTTKAPAQVKCFSPRWSIIPGQDLARLGGKAGSTQAQLGVNASLGTRILNWQSNYTIHIGPVDWQGLNRLLPAHPDQNQQSSKTMLNAVRMLARLKTDPTLKSTVRIRLRADSLQPARLGSGPESSGLDQPSKLGWNTWLGQPKNTAGFDDQTRCKYLEDTEFEEV